MHVKPEWAIQCSPHSESLSAITLVNQFKNLIQMAFESNGGTKDSESRSGPENQRVVPGPSANLQPRKLDLRPLPSSGLRQARCRT